MNLCNPRFIFGSNVTALLFCLVQFFASHSHSQNLSKSEFKGLFIQGNLMMMEGYHDTALKTFMVLYKDDPSHANVNYKIGRCYLNIPGKRYRAISYLENALRQTSGSYQADDPGEENAPEDVHYYLGQAYHYNLEFDKAISHFTKFKDLVGVWNAKYLAELEDWKATSANAKALVSRPVRAFLTNLGDSVNGPYPDYSPVIAADESMIAFTSRRKGTGEFKTDKDEYLEDIWVCYKGPYGTWTSARGISRDINSVNNEATIGLSADGQMMYVYRDDKGDGNIYTTKLDGKFWTPPAKIDNGPINSKKWEPSACLSADGNTMYFVSDRKGGFGGRDIYQCQLQTDGTWGKPINLGETINTSKDEDAPFIHPDGVTFFFSSKGHNSMGGFDVFHSNKISNNVWGKPQNMGYPINTVEDDIYLVTSSDGRRCYYASFRDEGKGEKDIYMITLDKPIVKSVAILVGYLKNRDGSPIPADSKLISKTKDGKKVVSTINESSGKFLQSMFPNKEYEVSIQVNGSNVFNTKFFLPSDSTYLALGRPYFRRTIYLDDSSVVFSSATPADSNKIKKVESMSGKILLSKQATDPAPNLTVQLLNDQGDLIASVKTDSAGSFRFNNIPTDNNYLLKLDENDPLLKKHQQFYLADSIGQVIMPSTQEGRFFLFKRLPSDLSKMTKLKTEDTAPLTKMMGRLIEGKNPGKPLSNIRLDLLDEEKKVINTVKTGTDGSFTFENLNPEDRYSLSLKENDPGLLKNKELYLANTRGNLIRKVEPKSDFFIFERLPPDLNSLSRLEEIDDAPLLAMQGRLQTGPPYEDLENVDLKLKDAEGEILQSAKTGKNGSFRFENLATDQTYTIELNQKDPSLKTGKNIYLTNAKGERVRVLAAGEKTSFDKLPADLMSLLPLKPLDEPVKKDEPKEIIHSRPMHPGDEDFDFVVYFPYNKKEINISVGSYLALMSKVENTIKVKGRAKVIISASSSKVPTRSYPDNKVLAESRANEVKDKVRSSISLKNIEDGKVEYEVNAKVSGPEYKNDAIANRKEYEKWQFVKVIVE